MKKRETTAPAASGAQTENIISLRGVSYTYPGAEEPALADISFELRQGEWLALVGGNGSGKTTLAKHLNALLVPTQGDCFICGMNTASEENTWRIRSAVSMVFQNPDNQIVSTVAIDDVAFGPENLGLPPEEIRRRVESALCVCGLEEQAQRCVYTLSGGQKQRLAIAGALALHARIIVLDEPTAMLDPAGRGEIDELLHTLRAKGVTIVLVTHRLEEIRDADRVIVLESGRIAWRGTPDELFRQERALERWGLELPPIFRLKMRLSSAGLVPENTASDAEGITQALCQSSSKT